MDAIDIANKRNAPSWETRGARQNENTFNETTNCTTKTAQKQTVPIPGTALTAFLKRYRADLLFCEPSRELSLAVDCVDGLLSLVEVRR